MLRLMIIEDELWMRRGLEKILDWNQLNIQLVSSARSGQEALELMEESAPDIIITDIKMPKIDGFGMLNKISEVLEQLPKIIIISGYDDFNYAKKAIRHGVVDYMLKPVDPEELKETIIRSKDLIRREEEESQKLTNLELKNAVHEILAFHSNYSNSESLPSPFYFHVIFSSEPLHESLEKINNKKMYYVSLVIGGHYLTMMGFIQKDALSSYRENHLAKIQKHQAVGVSDMKSNINDNFLVAYKEAEQAFQATYYQNMEYHNVRELTTILSREEETNILTSLQKGDKRTVDRVIDNLLKKHEQLEQKCIILFQLYLLLSRYLTPEQISSSNQSMFFYKLRYVYTLEDLNDVYSTAVDPLIKKLIQNFKPSKTSYIVKAKEYIGAHYNEAALSLDRVAAHLNLSPAYLSFIFKKETGMNFTSHVTRRRVEVAKEYLINSQSPIYEISDKVGYNDTKYFLRVFKKETGFTPNRYRELYK
ncbi:response regulator transcription factor [Virgibacillus sediminis]|uniref:Response regulator n=1 Tax=Virgibacillus sediminis TaxID=202260 RepID=A0ABV7A1R9_9BACI